MSVAMISSIWTNNARHKVDINKSSIYNVSPTWASSGTMYNVRALLVQIEEIIAIIPACQIISTICIMSVLQLYSS